MNTQRRIFRGRGGPTDRRLPKHNARRRQKQPIKRHECEGEVNFHDDQVLRHNDVVDNDSESSFSAQGSKEVDQELIEEEEIIIIQTHVPALVTHIKPSPPQLQASDNTAAGNESWRAEIAHLKRRVQNVQESIQLGTEGISNPTTYQQNVLHAVENCIREWRSILQHYGSNSYDNQQTDKNTMPIAMEPDTVKETSLQVYMLLQLAMQCGPLAGSQPGYFKRCGGVVARIVLDFLNQTVPDESECIFLKFSEKQAQAIDKWRINAETAAQQDKEPSKSALKKQQGKSKKKKSGKH